MQRQQILAMLDHGMQGEQMKPSLDCLWKRIEGSRIDKESVLVMIRLVHEIQLRQATIDLIVSGKLQGTDRGK